MENLNQDSRTNKSEARIQQECFDWFWNSYCTKLSPQREIIFHVPNEGKSQARLVSIGLVPGISDLVATWRGWTLFIEVKTPEGRQSIKQKGIENHVVEVYKCRYVVVRSLDEFKSFIDEIK